MSDSGLSFVYKTLGCFHSLQPNASPFEPPSVPTLLPSGYVRWQTIQLLLSPRDNVLFMQEAVKRYDVPTHDGGVFPKIIPREAFPEKPDVEMERWHKIVTGSLEQDHNMRKLKNSPFQSPRDSLGRSEGYFQNGRIPQVRRPSGLSRTNSQDQEAAGLLDSRRRSSVPDIASAFPPGAETGAQLRDDVPPFSAAPHSRRQPHGSPHRASKSTSQHRSSDASSSLHRYSTSSHRTSNSSANYRPNLSPSAERSINSPQQAVNDGRRRRSSSGHRYHRRRSPSTIHESSSSDSEASSENSHIGCDSRSKYPSDKSRRSSLFPPDFSKHHLRRHSHDATYLPEFKPPLPPRPNGYPQNNQNTSQSSKSAYAHAQVSGSGPRAKNSSGVNFRDNVFDSRGDDAVNSMPEMPAAPDSLGPNSNSKYRPLDPTGSRELVRIEGADLSRENSGGNGTDRDRVNQREYGAPLRISTLTGVGGRKYAAAEPRSTILSPKSIPSVPTSVTEMGDTRRTVWQ